MEKERGEEGERGYFCSLFKYKKKPHYYNNKLTTCYGTESFLSSSIPYLELDYFTIYDHFLDLEINTVRREVKGEGGD
jgi:hypothetical protein